MEKITFIIPSIGRPTLSNTIKSLKELYNQNWEAIIVFDGIKPTIEEDDPRIKILQMEKTGIKNHAANVRNEGIRHVKTNWVGFVDDDDILTPDYVDKFYEEIKNENTVDIIIFRMHIKKNKRTHPRIGAKSFVRNDVGISFCLKTSLFLEENNWFLPSSWEDFELLDKLRNQNKNIIISEHITYLVRPHEVIVN